MFDVKDANYLRYTQRFRYKEKRVKGVVLRRGLLYGICNFLLSFFLSFFRYPVLFKRLLKKSQENVFLYNGRNQYNAMICLYHAMQERGEAVVMIKTTELPMWQSFVYSIAHTIDFRTFFHDSSKDDRKLIANEFSTFWRSYGDYELVSLWLKKSVVKRLFIANDHDPLMRSCLQACRDYNVTSLYIQHASVTEKFPPLISTYSFLDGQDSLDKYLYNKTVSSKVFVIGGARFDIAKPIVREGSTKVIGIALTRQDDKSCWEHLVDDLKRNLPEYEIILRPHPRMDQDPIIKFSKSRNIQYSNPLVEDSFSFLNRSSILIANETSTHLDAMIMHKPTLLYSGLSLKGMRDHYGMVKRGLLKHCSSFEGLMRFIENPDICLPNVDAVRFFNASYQTPFEFKVSKLIVKIVLDNNYIFEELLEANGFTYYNYASFS